jgi:polyphosphate kinase
MTSDLGTLPPGRVIDPTDAVPDGDLDQTPVHADDLPDDRFSNRELSWLAFSARVLAQGEDKDEPLLERVKFLAIFAEILDEFYMVRIAGLKRRADTGLQVT